VWRTVLALKACARATPVLASALRAALTAALRRAARDRANPPDTGDRTMTTASRFEPVLYVRDQTDYRPASPSEVMDAARAALARRFRRGCALTSPRVARDYLLAHLAEREHETFCLIHLDNRHRMLGFVELFRGTIDGASVHPREVVKDALKHNSAAVVLVHNHPSGVPEPSQADEIITTRLKEALALIDVRVVDHLIVAGEGVVSLAERGAL
jgi:DNA repair protein RadC